MELVVTLKRVIVIEEVTHRLSSVEIHIYASNKQMSKLSNTTFHQLENILEFIQMCL